MIIADYRLIYKEKRLEYQLFVLWKNGVSHLDEILKILCSTYEIRIVLEKFWDKNTTLEKVMEIYQFSYEEAISKIKEIGYGKIFIIVGLDYSPVTKLFETKYGIIPVSKHAQEIKHYIRQLYGNTNFFHGTMIDFEFENDLRICLDMTKAEFIRYVSLRKE